MNLKRNDVLHNPRYAGSVMRYHTWMTHQRQTVGEHTWQCLRIWDEIWGPPNAYITTYFIWHDAGELVTGDLPFPVKANNDILKHTMNTLETEAVKNMGGMFPNITAEEKLRAKACDLIDMHEFGRVELLMGNQFAHPIIADTFAALEKLGLSSEDGMAVFKYLSRWGAP
jgi:hypothetical protein